MSATEAQVAAAQEALESHMLRRSGECTCGASLRSESLVVHVARTVADAVAAAGCQR